MEICLYATVFNNFNTIEESIKSVWRPDATIVITDNYSTDGTWEKLQKLKKEYNLLLYRLRSSRGKGRAYSLRHCPDNSITAYFDLDLKYNEAFHKVLEWAPKDKVTTDMDTGIIVLKEKLIEKGGWRDLNRAEDWEILARVGFDYFVPVINSENLYNEIVEKRELRYARGLRYYIRRFNNSIDTIRGVGYNWDDIKRLYLGKKKYKIITPFSYLLAKVKGVYRYYKDMNNALWFLLSALDKIVDLKEIGISDDYFIYSVWYTFYRTYSLEGIVDRKLVMKIGNVKKIICTDESVRFVKTNEGLRKSKLMAVTQNFECEERQLSI